MEYRENGTRYKDYKKWEDRKNAPYDYEGEGLVRHIMSNKIAYTENRVLKIINVAFEKSLVYVLKYVDRLKNFKNHHWKNR